MAKNPKRSSIISFFAAIFGIMLIGNSSIKNPLRTPAGREYGKPDNNDFEKYVNEYLQFVPDANLQKTLSSYFAEAAQIHRGANESIEVSNQKFLKENPCFSELAAEFYLDLTKDDFINFHKRLKDPSVTLKFAISLDEEAGKGALKDKKPGFLWEKLMSITDNDPNLAVQIIKMCGHDNAINEKPFLDSTHPSYQKLLARKRKLLGEAMEEWKNDSHDIRELLKLYRDSDKVEFGCFMTSSLYVPKSLGNEVAISDALRNRIVAVQAPTKGAKVLPAKNYHVLTGMFTGCRFRAETGYSFVGANVARLGARYYRAKMLSPYVHNRPAKLEWDRFNEDFFTDSLLENLKNGRLQERFSTYGFLLDPLKDDEVRKMSPIEIKKHALKVISQIDAGILWKEWYSKVKIPGIGEVYLPNRSRRQNSCGHGWSQERCQRALHVMDTWEIDFQWSQEAQYQGARAGEKLCKQIPPTEIEQRACRILKSRNTGPSKSPSGLR